MTDWDKLDEARNVVALWQAIARVALAGGASHEEAAEAASAVLVARARDTRSEKTVARQLESRTVTYTLAGGEQRHNTTGEDQ